jgi:hypothetical protein
VSHYFFHYLGEDLWSWAEAERHGLEAVALSFPSEPEVVAYSGMKHDVKVGIGDVDLGHVVPSSNEVADGVETLHLEVFVADEPVERLEIEDWPPSIGALLRHGEHDWVEGVAPRGGEGHFLHDTHL